MFFDTYIDPITGLDRAIEITQDQYTYIIKHHPNPKTVYLSF